MGMNGLRRAGMAFGRRETKIKFQRSFPALPPTGRWRSRSEGRNKRDGLLEIGRRLLNPIQRGQKHARIVVQMRREWSARDRPTNKPQRRRVVPLTVQGQNKDR
jgi:hypothetical protein